MVMRLRNRHRSMKEQEVVCVDNTTKKDLEWWEKFMEKFNGASIMWMTQHKEGNALLGSDACLGRNGSKHG